MIRLRLLWFAFMFAFLCFQVAAIGDYTNFKGDYKVFSLGDSQEVAKDKAAFLKKKKEISGTLRSFTYNATMGKEAVQFRLNFLEDKLCHIFVASHRTYSASDYYHGLQAYFLNDFKPVFITAYGEPTKDLGYPGFFIADGTSYACMWELEKKVIRVGVKRNSIIPTVNGGASYYPVIDIYDKEYLAGLQEQQAANTEDASKDF